MIEQLKQIIDSLQPGATPNNIEQYLPVLLTNLKDDFTQLTGLLDRAQWAANEPALITIDEERDLFLNWLNYAKELIGSGDAALRVILEAHTTGQNLTEAEFKHISTLMLKLLSASHDKYHTVLGSEAFSDHKGRTLIESYLNQFITLLEAPAQRTSPIIPDDVETSLPAALAEIQSALAEKRDKLSQKKGKKTYSCFLSYAWGNATHELVVAHVAAQLEAAGIKVYFDRWQDVPGKQIQDFVSHINTVDWIIIFGSQLYQQKYKRRATSKHEREHVVKAEVNIMNTLAMSSTKRAKTVIPVLLEGTNQTALPHPFFNDQIPIDLGHGNYVDHVIRLIKTLYKIEPIRRYPQSEHFQQNIPDSSAAAASSSAASSSAAYSGYSSTERTDYSASAGLFGNRNQRAKHQIARQSLLSSDDGMVSKSTLWNLPDTSKNYQERLAYNKRIEDALVAQTQGVITQAITGSGGIGKTQLALNYAHQQQEKYQFIRFILAETQSELEHNYRIFAQALDVATEGREIDFIREDVKKRLAKCLSDPQKALVIFDNANDQSTVAPFLDDLKSLGIVDVLITTRNEAADWENSIPVGVYEPYEAISYVCRTLVKEKQFVLMDTPLQAFCQEQQDAIKNNTLSWSTLTTTESDTRLQSARDFVHLLGYYPIALTHALAFCVAEDMKLSTYMQAFQENMREVIKGQDDFEQGELDDYHYFSNKILDNQYGKTIYIAFKFIFDKLLNDTAKGSRAAKQVAAGTLKTLASLCYLSPDSIPNSLLTTLIQTQLATAQGAAGPIRGRTIKQVRDQLMKFGILHFTSESNTYYTHRLIHSVVQFFWTEVLPTRPEGQEILPDQEDLVTALVHCINQSFPSASQIDGNTPQAKTLISYTLHLEAVHSARVSLQMKETADTVMLQSNLGFLYHINSEALQAITWHNRALEAVNTVEPSDNQNLNEKIVIRRARSLVEIHQYRQAQKALLAQFPDIKNDRGSSLLAQDCYADLLCRMNNQEEAKRVIKRYLSRLTSQAQSSDAPVNDDESYVQAHLYYQLAKLNHHFGKHEQAKEQVSKAIDCSTWDNERLLAEYYLLLAQIHATLKEHDLAITAGDKAISYAEGFYSTEHIQVGCYLVHYARALIDTPRRADRSRVANHAKRLLNKLSQKGNPNAEYYLAWAYDKGVFVEYKEQLAKGFAFEHYEKAATSGNNLAQLHLAKVYLSAKGKSQFLTRYVREDKAYTLLKQAAETSFLAEYELAKMISKQQGLARHINEEERNELIFKHFKSAAKSGLSDAEFSLGCFYLNNQAPQNIPIEDQKTEAVQWLKLAAEQLHENARKLLVLLCIQYIHTTNEAINPDLLFFTAKINYPAGVRTLLQLGAELNKKQLGSGITALHIAAVEKNLLAVMALIEAGADFNVADNLGRTVLYHAAQGGQPDIIRHLQQHGININQPALDGSRAINIAAMGGHFAAFEALIEAGADFNVEDHDGFTVLHHAAHGGQPDIIRHLQQHGININQPARDGKRAINIAAMEGHFAAFEALIEAGADFNVTDNLGRTVLHHAAQGGQLDIILHLQQQGININQPALDGRRAIHQAALSGHFAAFEALMETGADFNAADHRGLTVLHAAAHGGQPDIIRHLLQQGININQSAPGGKQAINIAAMEGHFAAFEALIEAGADFNVADNLGRTVLHHAAQGGQPDIIRHLHQQGININQPALDGSRAINIATMGGHFAAFEALIEAGADFNVADHDGLTVLHHAAQGGQPDIIRHLQQQGININQPALDGRRAIHQAALSGHFAAFKALIEADADFNVADNSGWTVLHHAAQGGQPDIIRHLQQQGISINQPALDGKRAINIAAMEGQFATFEALIEAGADFNVASNSGWTVLHHAAQGGQPDIIRHLQQHGININQSAPGGKQAIHIAAMGGHFAAFEALIEAGAGFNVTDNLGRTVLHHAAQGGQPDIIRHLLQHGININQPALNGKRAIHQAALSGHFTTFKALIDTGADINVADHDCWTVLHHAAQGGQPDIIRHLQQGIKINQPAQDGKRAIHIAAMFGHFTAFEAMMEADADINVADNFGRTVLHYAAQGGQPDIIRHLHQQGININQPALDGTRAIHQAALRGHFAAFKALIDAGADFNVADNSGRTVLHHAAQGGQPNIIRYLQQQGINTNQPALDGTRAIHIAALGGHFAAFESLIEAGADINVANNFGRTVLHYAAKGGQPDIIRHLIKKGLSVNKEDKIGMRPIHVAAALNHSIALKVLLELGAEIDPDVVSISNDHPNIRNIILEALGYKQPDQTNPAATATPSTNETTPHSPQASSSSAAAPLSP
jgi:ankyrin repeat protein